MRVRVFCPHWKAILLRNKYLRQIYAREQREFLPNMYMTQKPSERACDHKRLRAIDFIGVIEFCSSFIWLYCSSNLWWFLWSWMWFDWLWLWFFFIQFWFSAKLTEDRCLSLMPTYRWLFLLHMATSRTMKFWRKKYRPFNSFTRNITAKCCNRKRIFRRNHGGSGQFQTN